MTSASSRVEPWSSDVVKQGVVPTAQSTSGLAPHDPHDVVVVLPDVRLVRRHGAQRPDAPHRTRGAQRAQVVDGLVRRLTEILPRETDDRVRVGVRMVLHPGQHRCPRRAHTQSNPAQPLEDRHRRHAPKSGPFLESIKKQASDALATEQRFRGRRSHAGPAAAPPAPGVIRVADGSGGSRTPASATGSAGLGSRLHPGLLDRRMRATGLRRPGCGTRHAESRHAAGPASRPTWPPERVTRRRRAPRAVTADRGYGRALVESDLHAFDVAKALIPRQGQTPRHESWNTDEAFAAWSSGAPDRSAQNTLGPAPSWTASTCANLVRARGVRPQPGEDRAAAG